MRSIATLALSIVFTLPGRAVAQHAGHEHGTSPGGDSAFRAMQARGKRAMGVDQYSSIHRFDDLADGGRIELQRDRDDSAGTSTIRAHIRTIARAFAAGDFSTPGSVHLEAVPGSATLRARRSAIRYEVIDLPRGAALRIRTADPQAIAAAHRFLAYQRGEHRASGAH